MPGAYHSELWKQSWTAAEVEAAGASVACGCAVLPAKHCGGGGGAWNQTDECARSQALLSSRRPSAPRRTWGQTPTSIRSNLPALCGASCAAQEDIIDESLKLFRAQVFFKNFEVRPRACPPVPVACLPTLSRCLTSRLCVLACVRFQRRRI